MNIKDVTERIIYLENIIDDYIANGFTKLALEAQKELDTLTKQLESLETKRSTAKARREFQDF